MPDCEYSFCESVHATSTSPWHIRPLTSAGRKLGGGIDTPSLCGVVRVGWDLKTPIDDVRLRHCGVCKTCKAVYRERTEG